MIIEVNCFTNYKDEYILVYNDGTTDIIKGASTSFGAFYACRCKNESALDVPLSTVKYLININDIILDIGIIK